MLANMPLYTAKDVAVAQEASKMPVHSALSCMPHHMVGIIGHARWMPLLEDTSSGTIGQASTQPKRGHNEEEEVLPIVH